MKKSFGRVVNEVIEDADITLEVIDARFMNEMRNPYIEKKIQEKKKQRIVVVNKCDYLSEEEIVQLKKTFRDYVFLSATKHMGIGSLFRAIRMKKGIIKKKEIVIGVVGYPNVGKSSVINALKGRHSAPTSSEAGFTKGKQKLRISGDMLMIDTPGVMAHSKTQVEELTVLGAKNPSSIKDPDLAVFRLMAMYPNIIEEHYGILRAGYKEQRLEQIALKYNLKLREGKPDTEQMARRILMEWQKGKIKRKI